MQYFVPPAEGFKPKRHSLRANQYKRRKRKRDEDGEELTVSPEPSQQSGVTSNMQSARSSFAPLTAADTDQLRVAGLLPDDAFDLPKRPFPHAPASSRAGKYMTTDVVQRELAAMKPPLYVPASETAHADGTETWRSLRNTHLGNLTTILHRCLLEGNYERAGRAWGMLLRSRAGGQRLDVRAHGRWAIGAEIHLQRNRISRQSQPERVDSDDSSSIQSQTEALSASIEEHIFSDEGFRLARHYYDLLILQWPLSKRHPNMVAKGHFIPAMFSVWIYEVSQQSRIARERSRRTQRESSRRSDSLPRGSDDADLDHPDDQEEEANDQNAHTKQNTMSDEERQIVNIELTRAHEIAERLDQVLGAPPFDKRPDLLQLRGMVGLWIVDLLALEASDPEPNDQDGWASDSSREDGDEMDIHGANTRSAPRLQSRQRTLDKQSQADDAQDFFRRAAQNGALLWDGLRRLGSEADR